MNTQQKIEILQAAKQCLPIQFRPLRPRREGHVPRWLDHPNHQQFNFEFFEYRLKPESNPDFFWTNRYHDKRGYFTMGYFETQDEARFYACPHRKHKTIRLPASSITNNNQST